MNEQSFNILNNIISIKKNTDNFLEQKILENEDSFEIFDSNYNINNKPIRNKEKLLIYKNDDKEKKKVENNTFIKEKNNNKINGNSNITPINENSNHKNKKYLNNSINNIKKGYNMIENIIKEIKNDLAKYNNENQINNNYISNINDNKKAKIKNNNNYIKVEKIKKNSENASLSDRNFLNIRKIKKSQNIHNRSIEDNINHSSFNDNNEINVDNKIKIYQKLFEIKMNNLKIKQNNKTIYFNQNNFFSYTPKKMIKSHSSVEIFSQDEKIKRKKVNHNKKKLNKNNSDKDTYINKSNIDIYYKKNKIFKENVEDDLTTIKSKISRAQRQNSLSSSISNSSMEKFIRTYERFKEMENKQKERLEHLKKQKEENYKKNCYFSPKINKKSHKLKKKFNTQKNISEEEKKKYENIQLEIKKKKEEKIMLEIESSRINKNRKLSEVSNGLNKIYESEKIINGKNIRKKSIDELIKKNEKDNFKINKKLKELVNSNLNKSNNNNLYLNNKNLKLKGKEKTDNSSIRRDILNKKDKQEKQKILKNIHSPTFTPKYFNNENKKGKTYIEEKSRNKINNLRNKENKNMIKNKTNNSINCSNYFINNKDITKKNIKIYQ